MNEYEAHESSYDHQHKKRLKDMKEMQRQVQTAGRKEDKGPLMSIKLGSATSKPKTGGFKKGGFKNAFGPIEDQAEDVKREQQDPDNELGQKIKGEQDLEEDSDVTDQEDYYDPRRPTGCTPSCPSLSV